MIGESFAIFEVQFGLQVVVDGTPEEDVEVVLSRHHLQLAAVSEVQQQQEETVPYLWDY